MISPFGNPRWLSPSTNGASRGRRRSPATTQTAAQMQQSGQVAGFFFEETRGSPTSQRRALGLHPNRAL